MAPPISLLESTFLHAQGIGETTERRLWEAGAVDWPSYLDRAGRDWPLSASQCALLTPTVEDSVERLEEEDFAWFARRLPQAEHWRAVPAFGHRLAFVDIETTGGMEPDDLTVVGIFDGYRMRQFVRGIDLEQAPEALEDAALLVTFFGTGFDLPFLRRAFPGLRLPQLHVDLCYMLRKLGYRGGLKSIEAQMGIRRSGATTGLSGWDAVRLWQEYRRGKDSSLETLLAYNAEDVRNMSDLLSEGYKKRARRLLAGSESG
ncbi:MAG TPA: ribonuclease H-like domain-containing protein [Chthonomonadaceae bacterium]|nr:ribonuclease H-like domain-containing protein [Chthonomonadaceae bacterium]